MKFLFPVLALIQLCVILTVNGLNSLTQKFLFQTDSDRITTISTLVNNNHPFLFQLAYGLFSQKQYRLIRQYFHPSVQDIVFYNAYSFYITLGTTTAGDKDSKYGWYLSSHRYKNLDIRDTKSTYVNLHSPGWTAKRWRLTPIVSRVSGIAFKITLAYDELQYDKVNQATWGLAAERIVQYDRPTSTDTRVIAGQGRTSAWILCPIKGGVYYKILQGGGDVVSGSDQVGWMLSVGDARTTSDGSLDNSNYVFVSSQPNPGYYWSIIFAG